MEHNPLRFQEMKHFLAFITAGDKAGIIKRGNGQVRPAVFARFPPYGREQTLWMVKHALDIGLNGILINNVETKEQAENIVRTMRPTQRRDSKIPNPPGVRGTVVCGFWAAGGGDCRSHADLWPLNPDGDLIFWPMIETMEGVRNADAIAQVPGVGGFYLGASGDLSADLGVAGTHPDVDAAMAKILSVCQARTIAVWRHRQRGERRRIHEARLQDHQFRRSRRRSQRRQRGGKARGTEGGREALILLRFAHSPLRRCALPL